MGTHPIFESDFDCLTECSSIIVLFYSSNVMPAQDSDSQNSSGSSEMDRYDQFEPNFPETDSCSEFSDEPVLPIQSLPSNERRVEIPGSNDTLVSTSTSFGDEDPSARFIHHPKSAPNPEAVPQNTPEMKATKSLKLGEDTTASSVGSSNTLGIKRKRAINKKCPFKKRKNKKH